MKEKNALSFAGQKSSPFAFIRAAAAHHNIAILYIKYIYIICSLRTYIYVCVCVQICITVICYFNDLYTLTTKLARDFAVFFHNNNIIIPFQIYYMNNNNTRYTLHVRLNILLYFNRSMVSSLFRLDRLDQYLNWSICFYEFSWYIIMSIVSANHLIFT